MLSDHLMQRRIDVLGHPTGVTANKEIAAGLQPFENLGAVFSHPILDVNLVILIATESRVQSLKQTRICISFQHVAVKKISL